MRVALFSERIAAVPNLGLYPVETCPKGRKIEL
jgi:hypothetical protein